MCAVWAPIFCVARLIAEGELGNVHGSVALYLIVVILKKIGVGIALGAVIGILTGIRGGDGRRRAVINHSLPR